MWKMVAIGVVVALALIGGASSAFMVTEVYKDLRFIHDVRIASEEQVKRRAAQEAARANAQKPPTPVPVPTPAPSDVK